MLKVKKIVAATFGNAIEYYDVTLYGFFTVFLSPLFFPSDTILNSHLASLGTFAISFIARPFGGLIFGYIGDRFGRKKALVWAILLVTVPTTVIAILPVYSSIGILAPIILIICRILQGISTGGEYSGAAIFLSEHYQGRNAGVICSLLPSSSLIGAVLGTCLGGISTLPFMPSWGWRVPFLLGGLFGIIGYVLRNSLTESPDFLKFKEQTTSIKLTAWRLIQNYHKPFLCTLGIAAYHLVLFYIPIVYIVQFMLPKNTLISSGMFLNMTVMSLLIILFPFMGLIADKFGKVRIMQISMLMTLLLALPLFIFLINNNSLKTVLFVLISLVTLSSASVAASVSLLPSFFPIQGRYIAMALAVGLGEALGGTTPLVCHGLVVYLQNPLMPAFYLMIWSMIGLLSINYAKQNH